MKVIESKVWAATVGAGAGGILTTFILWACGVLFFGASTSATDAVAAVSATPAPVSALVGVLVTVGGTFAGGYFAPHTPRPDLSAAPAAPVAPVAAPVVSEPVTPPVVA